MEQTVYVDLFFIINFSMDFLCFYLSSQLLDSRLSLLRAVIASALGGIYANMTLFMSIGGLAEILIDVLACALMCIVAFGIKRRITIHICIYIAISMILGGFMTAMFELLNRLEIPFEELSGDGISAWVLLILAVISACMTLFGGRFLKKRSVRRRTSVELTLSGRCVCLPAFCDSGNMLRDPLSSRACILVDARALKGVVPEEILKNAMSGRTDIPHGISEDMRRRIRLVPTRTATGTGVLVALRVDTVSVGVGKDEREVDALIALCELGESAEGCSALVPSELMII